MKPQAHLTYEELAELQRRAHAVRAEAVADMFKALKTALRNLLHLGGSKTA